MIRTLRRSILPASVVLGICLLALAAGYFSAGDQHPKPAAAVATEQPASASDSGGRIIGGRIVSSEPPNLVVDDGNGPQMYPLNDLENQGIEALDPIAASAIKVGDWINAGATDNADTTFTLSGFVVIPGDRVQTP